MKTSSRILDPRSRAASSRRGQCALGVMTKEPRAGASKTRLVPPLTHEEAARLSVAFLCDTAANVADACADSSRDARATHPVAVYTPDRAESVFDRLLPSNFALLAQRGDTLGERLFHASADLLHLGYESCCLINADSPTLPRSLLTAAVAELGRPGDRLVLGPADDGGYYLIGVKRAHRRLFDEIAWSTGEVLTQTIERAREIDLDVELLPAWYDVDDASTLRRLCDEVFDAVGIGRIGVEHGEPRACDATRLIPYPAPRTRDELARLLRAEGRARLLPDSLNMRAREKGIA